MKTIVFGPNVITNAIGTFSKSGRIASGVDGLTVIAPKGRNWELTYVTSTSGEGNKYIEYGPGEELDLDIDVENKLMTATVASENALTNILAQAAIFKSEFGMNTKVNITNAFEISEGTMASAMLSGASFDYLMFAVTSQAQLDSLLAVISPDILVMVDIDGVREQITVPEGRRVAILANGGWKFKKRDGLVIMYR